MATPTVNSESMIVGGNHWIYAAPLGTALPTDVGTSPGDGLNAAFVCLGSTADSGATFTVDTQTTDLYVSQSDDPVRTIVNSKKASITAPLVEFSGDVLIAAFGGGTITSTANGYKYTPPASGTIDEQSYVLDVQDGSELTRIVIERGQVAGSVAANLTKSALASLPITITGLAPVTLSTAWFLVGTNDALAGGGS